MPKKPTILVTGQGPDVVRGSLSAIGDSFIIHHWQGSGPPYLHVHYEDDEAWHILEGSLSFSFPEGKLIATKGTTVFVPAGLPHTYSADEGSRYLVILTPRLDQLIAELHKTPIKDHAAVMKKYRSEILD
jgi:mannose-6-phosphate isomerase-like protein (cupin superfamily)